MSYKINAFGIEIICNTPEEVAELIRLLKNWPVQRIKIEEKSVQSPKINIENFT